jgi:DNA modification methylase
MADPKIEMLPVSGLTPYGRNSRTHSEMQIKQIEASIKEFGFTNPVLIDGKGGIIAGHGRVVAARNLGMATVPCVRLDHLTKAQKKAYIIADNQLALNAGWNFDVLAVEIDELNDEGFDLDLLGFSKDELNELIGTPDTVEGLTDPDDVPEPPEEPVTKLGDVWILGKHRLMCGDSCNVSDWDRLMGGAMADIVWTDPPYNVAYESKNAGKIKNDNMNDKNFKQFLVDAYTCLFMVMKPGAAIYVAHADKEGLNFRAAFTAAGLKLSGCLIWQKNSMVLGRSDYQWIHEPILYGWKPGAAHHWYGGRKNTTVVAMGDDSPFVQQEDGSYSLTIGDRVFTVSASTTVEEHPSSIFYHDRPIRSSEHPTMKPVTLVERMLKHNAKPGDVVVDAFGGSGTTMISAHRLGMSARLMELDPKFCDVIITRWQNFTGQKAILEET